MLLIDAAQIHIGGALVLLELLIKELLQKEIPFVIIIDKRCTSHTVNSATHKMISKSYLNRKAIYKNIVNKYNIDVILSFNSFAPPYKIHNVRKITYFHNLNLLSNSNFEKASLKYKFFQTLKRLYLKQKLKNTDYYVFQSNLILNQFLGEYSFDKKKCLILPFYDDELLNEVVDYNYDKECNTFCYISIPYSHKNHTILLDVWEKLLNDGLNPILKLTIPKEHISLLSRICEINHKGANILNLGIISPIDALKHTGKSQFCIFPSLSESLGLGLVEAQKLGCKIIASDLPYVHEVIRPNLTFDPNNSDDIKEKIVIALSKNKNLLNSELIMKNHLSELVELIR